MEKKCLYCGKSFEVSSKHPEVACCSRKCGAMLRGINLGRYTVKCECCGKTFTKLINDKVAPVRFCSRFCYDKFREESRPSCDNCGKRVKPGYLQKSKRHYCSEQCRAEGLKPKPRPCVNCGAVIVPIKYHSAAKKIIAHNAGKTCSAKCQNEWIRSNPERKEKISAAFTGKLHPNWQGGKSAFNNSCHRGSGWIAIARKVRDRDKHICQRCGKTESENGRALDVHHMIPYHNINDQKRSNKMSNLVSLCKSCHRKEDNKVSQKQIILPFAIMAQEKRRAARA